MADMLLTVQEVADLLKTNVDYVYKLNRSGLLQFMKIGRLKCRRSTVERFLENYEGYDVSDPSNIRPLREEDNE